MSDEKPARRPRWRKKRYRIPVVVVVLLAGFMYANNTTAFTATPEAAPTILAHRGMSQTFGTDGLESDTCTAERIYPPAHGYLENTIAGMRAAFDAGADQVEFDVHWTKDGQFAVFHDWEVDCRTDGTGTTREHTMDELRALDIGYGYTADGGATHPFRGQGIGLMPTLDEVLAAFPDRQLLVHVKSDDAEEGKALADRLATLDQTRLNDLVTVYGGDAPVAALRETLPGVRVMSRAVMTDCLGRYEAYGWTGLVADACAKTQLHIPEGLAGLLWGWSTKFAARMAEADARIVIVAGDGGFSEGFDTPADLERLPEGFTGMVWTNRVDVVGPLLT